MNYLRDRFPLVIIVCFVVIGLLGFQFVSKPARASLGNSGIPVQCFPDTLGNTIAPDESAFFRCVAADGTLFNDNQQRVPAGYYLLITDIVITPESGDSTIGAFNLTLYADSGKSNWEYGVEFRDLTGNTVSEHYTVPYMVLPENYRVEGYNQAATYSLNIYLSGLLVTNVSYMPLAVR